MRHDVKRHDVAIVGGGLVGASLAIALDRIGRDVALVEAAPPGALPAVFDERNLSFAEATVHGLRAAGRAAEVACARGPHPPHPCQPAGRFRARGARCARARARSIRPGRRRTRLRTGAGSTPVRMHAHHALSTDALRRQRRRGRCAVLHLRDADGNARNIAARLLVGADGTRSGVRDTLGIGADERDFGQTLFVARVRAERAPDGTAYERFGPHGPTALLPRGDGHFGVVHGVAREDAEAVAALDDAAWLARVQDAFGWRAGRLLASGPRSAYPIVQVVARAVVAERAAIVGNAAQTLHPIGAQGFNLGLRDALTLAELIEAGGDPGGAALLAEHARRRQAIAKRRCNSPAASPR
jgi:2-octaprenyl-6-methoxyphenol hydroxylase